MHRTSLYPDSGVDGERDWWNQMVSTSAAIQSDVHSSATSDFRYCLPGCQHHAVNPMEPAPHHFLQVSPRRPFSSAGAFNSLYLIADVR